MTTLGSGFRVQGSGHVPRTPNPQPRTFSHGQATIEYLLIALGAISTIVVVSAVTGSVRARANAVMTMQLGRVNAIPQQ